MGVPDELPERWNRVSLDELVFPLSDATQLRDIFEQGRDAFQEGGRTGEWSR